VAEVDIWELLLAFAWMLVRVLIVSLKYGYFRPEELEAIRCAAGGRAGSP
jgi:hypothetical protein